MSPGHTVGNVAESMQECATAFFSLPFPRLQPPKPLYSGLICMPAFLLGMLMSRYVTSYKKAARARVCVTA